MGLEFQSQKILPMRDRGNCVKRYDYLLGSDAMILTVVIGALVL